MGLAIFEGARGSKFVADSGFGEIVANISIAADAPVISCAREAAAEPLLRRLGKKSQRQLWDGWRQRRPGYNPANPPGFSTHERRNDGVAYRLPRGAWLRKWQRGIDVQRDRVPAFCAEARKRKFIVTLTYPGTLSESQHVNFRKRPKVNWWRYKPVKRGDTNRRARKVVRLLTVLSSPKTGKPYLDSGWKVHRKYDVHVENAVKRWQQDHHQKADGEVGIHTITGMRAQNRRRKARDKARRRKKK